MKKAEIKAAVARKFPGVKVKISIISGKTYIGIVEAPVSLIHGYHSDSIVFINNEEIKQGGMWNNTFHLTFNGQFVFSFLHSLVPDAHLSLGFPTRTGFERFSVVSI